MIILFFSYDLQLLMFLISFWDKQTERSDGSSDCDCFPILMLRTQVGYMEDCAPRAAPLALGGSVLPFSRQVGRYLPP